MSGPVLLRLLLLVSILATGMAPTARSQESADQEKLELARRYLELYDLQTRTSINAEAYAKEIVRYSANQIPKADASTRKELEKEFASKIVEYQNALVPRYVQTIAKYLSKDELHAAIGFAESPEGSSIRRKLPQVLREIADVHYANSFADYLRLWEDAKAELRRRGRRL